MPWGLYVALLGPLGTGSYCPRLSWTALPPLRERSGEVEGLGCVFSKAPSEKVETQISTAPDSDRMVGSCMCIAGHYDSQPGP